MSEEKKKWRVIDTGLRRAAENMALNKTILEAHQEGLIPHTLRFLQFTPCALLGFHQSAEQELRLDYCQENGIDIQRRITGGGAIYFDQTQIGWELYLDKKTLGTADMSQIAKRICTAAAKGISSLGVNAVFRPRNDIEVDGKKVSGTGGAFDGDSILYQGTLLVDFDIGRMLRVLRIPAEKISDKAIASAQERVANLKDLLGEAPSMEKVKQAITNAFAEEFAVEFEPADALSDAEDKIYQEALAEIDSDEWINQHNRPREETREVSSIYKSSGGLMRASVFVDSVKERIKQVWITGDFFVTPRRMVADLESVLRDTPISEVENNIRQFFKNFSGEMMMLTEDDFVTLIKTALAEETTEVAV